MILRILMWSNIDYHGPFLLEVPEEELQALLIQPQTIRPSICSFVDLKIAEYASDASEVTILIQLTTPAMNAMSPAITALMLVLPNALEICALKATTGIILFNIITITALPINARIHGAKDATTSIILPHASNASMNILWHPLSLVPAHLA